MDGRIFFLHCPNGGGHRAQPQLSPGPTAAHNHGAGTQDTGPDVRRWRGRGCPSLSPCGGRGSCPGAGPGWGDARRTSRGRGGPPGGGAGGRDGAGGKPQKIRRCARKRSPPLEKKSVSAEGVATSYGGGTQNLYTSDMYIRPASVNADFGLGRGLSKRGRPLLYIHIMQGSYAPNLVCVENRHMGCRFCVD